MRKLRTINYIALIIPNNIFSEPPRINEMKKLPDERVFINAPPESVDDESFAAASFSINGGIDFVI